MENEHNKPVKRPITKEDIILWVTKTVSYITNAILILILLGLVGGGVYLLYIAILA